MLLMLMTIGGLVTAGVVIVVAVITKRTWLRNFVFGGVAVWFVFYVAMLFGFSLFSQEKNARVERGQGVLRLLSRLPHAHSRDRSADS